MITRIQKRENPFVQIDKRPLEDDRLSWRAKGILAYLLSKPDGWMVKMDDIIAHGKEGRDAVINAMKELRAAGYAWTEKPRSDGGLLCGEVWIISEEPRCPEKPVPGKTGALENRRPVKPPLSNNDPERDNEKSNNDAFALDASPPKRKPMAGTVNGHKPELPLIEDFCASIGLARSDGESALLRWRARGWPKNWHADLRRYQHEGWMPSQRGQGPQKSLMAQGKDPLGAFWEGGEQ